MVEVKEDIQLKEEIKEEIILPIIESGVDLENVISSVKNEDDEFIEALVNVTKEINNPVKCDSDKKSSILTSLVKSCHDLDVRMNVTEEKTEVKTQGEDLPQTSHEAGSKNEIMEDPFTVNYESNGTDGSLRDLDSLQKNNDKLTRRSSRVKKISEKEKFICKYCDKRFTEDNLRIHVRTHTGMRPYECSFCWKRYISKWLLNRHMVNHTGKQYTCSICCKSFFQSQGLKSHMLIHEGKRPFKCAQCGKDFRQKITLMTHLSRRHRPSTEIEGTYVDKEKSIKSENIETDHSAELRVNDIKLNCTFRCDDCCVAFRSRDNLMEHMKRIHQDTHDTFTCDICGKIFKHRDTLIIHMKNMHIRENLCLYHCRICGMASKSKANRKKHERLHKNEYTFKCNICNMSFKEKGGLKCHFIQAHKSEKPYKCENCDSSFKNKNNLNQHIEVHHNNTEIKFSCHICNKEFKRKCYLNRHVSTHTNADKKYECDHCGLKCRSKTDIAKHVLTHFGAVERPHACDLCGARFTKHSHMVRHKRIHSDERIFSCDLCDKAYKDTSSLKIHRESIHCGSSFSCQNCGFLSTNRQSFNRHLRTCQS